MILLSNTKKNNGRKYCSLSSLLENLCSGVLQLKNLKFSSGPDIEVICYLKPEGIALMEMQPHDSKGIHVHLIQDGSCEHLLPMIEKWMESYVLKKLPPSTLPLVQVEFPSYTSRILLKILPSIPFGHSMSYGELAKIAGNPKAFRAAGSACGKNPWPLVIPCHRILASNQRLGGFTSGLEIKRRLLNFEGIHYLDVC